MRFFPAVRLSELRARQRRDRQKLAESTNALNQFVREKTRPIQFLIDHSGAIVGGVGSILAVYGIGASVMGPTTKVASAPTRRAIGVLGRIAKMGLGVAVRAATPALTSLISKTWRKATKSSSTPPKPDNNPI